MSNNKQCRWGILGAAVIARKFWNSVRLADNAVLTGVASRSKNRATEFLTECNQRLVVSEPPTVFDDYLALIKSPTIDAVYIPLPTGIREQWVLAAAEHGKHVLCEKPCAVSEAGMARMISACEKAGVQFMDNVMFMHSQRLSGLKKALADRQAFGDLKRICSQFSFCADDSFFRENIRSDMAMEPWGCLGDLGYYNIRMALVVMGDQLPVRVIGRNIDGNWDRPTREFSGEMLFENGVTASFYCSFVTANQQWVQFAGKKGNVAINDFCLPFFGNRSHFQHDSPQFNRSGFDFNYESCVTSSFFDEYSNAHESAQEVALVRNFSRLVLNGTTDSYWPSISQKTQTIMDALLNSARSGEPVSIDG